MSWLLLALEGALAPLIGLGVILSFAFSRRRSLLAALGAELPERLGALSPEGKAALAGRRVWWLHAASAGEIGGLAPLIEALAARPDAPALLVTSTTASGRDFAKRLKGVAWAQLAPADAWYCVSRFLREAAPERLILSETELWPSMILLARRRGLRPVLVNGRLNPRSVPRYGWIRPLLRPVFDALEAVYAQSEIDARRWRDLGAPAGKVRSLGNTKYDRPSHPAADTTVVKALDRLGWRQHPLFVAGSTHPVEEEKVLKAWHDARQQGLKLVIAPRHPERAEECWRAVRRFDPNAARWTRLDEAPPGARVLLIDTMGALAAFWPLALVGYVGGTLVPVGGHNLLEPAQAGVPVLYGPHTEHIEVPGLLLENMGGGMRVSDEKELCASLLGLFLDLDRARAMGVKARALAEELRGATGRLLEALDA